MKVFNLVRNSIALILFAAHIFQLYGQPSVAKSVTYGTPEDYKRLYFLNTQYIQSWVRSDTMTYNHLLWADDFVHQNSTDGLLYPKKQISPIFGTPRFERLEYFYPENVRIQFISNDVAMVFARTALRFAGHPEEYLGQYNDVYAKRNGKWMCVSANVTPLTKPDEALPPLTKVPASAALISYVNGSDEDREMLRSLNDKQAEAFLTGQRDLAENILSDDYTLLAANGLLYTRAETLEQMRPRSNDAGAASYEIKNLTIRFVTPQVAMLHALAVFQQADEKAAIQYNDIYVKRSGRWICVSGNNTPVRN